MLVWGCILGELMVIICVLEVVRESLPFGLNVWSLAVILSLRLGARGCELAFRMRSGFFD